MRPLHHACSSLVFILAFALCSSVTYAVDGCSSTGLKVASPIYLDTNVFGITAADFNVDGHLDLAVSPNGPSGEVWILLGRGGTEKFGPPIGYSTGGRPARLAAADFNGDGKADLAVSVAGFSVPNTLAILLNDGTGKFGAPNLLNLTGDPAQPVIGDVNNDGKLDIVVGLSTGTTSGVVSVLLGNGSGGFSQAPNSPFATSSVNIGVVRIGDFNEDGKLDLATPGNSSGVDVRLGDGTGRFGPPIFTPTGGNWLSLTLGDFNQDSHLDALLDDRMLLGTGTGGFGAPIVISLPPNSTAALAGDVNQDGKLDIVVAGGGITIMLGNGAGNFIQGRSYASGIAIFGAASSFGGLGDFNEDGKVDLVGVIPSGIAILEGDGTGAFNDALSYQTSIATAGYLIAADFNNDGKQDFATSSKFLGFTGSRIEVALGDGTGGFTKKSVINFGTNPPDAFAAGDFNSDGKLDLAVTQPSNGRLAILLNDGTGGFAPDGFSAPSFFLGAFAIRTGDFNNDGKTDLAGMSSGSLSVLLGDGGGGFSTNGFSFAGGPNFANDLAIADVNADGKSDIAVVGNNAVQVFHGNGSGSFISAGSLATPGQPISIAIRDLNGDGRPDIVVSNSIIGGTPLSRVTISINGASGFSAGVSYLTDAAGVVGIGDFNNDSKLDVVVSSGHGVVGSAIDGVAILTNKGAGELNAPVNLSVGEFSSFVAVSDFNNDVKDDVLVSRGSSVALLLNETAPSRECLSVDDVTVTEGDSGTTNATFTVTLSAATAQSVRVNYFVIPAFVNNSPATKGTDFQNVPGTVTFLPGEITQTINVPVNGDLTDEFDQFFYVVLTTPVNALVSDGKGLGTIVDNDAPPTITINDVSVAEGTQTEATAIFNVSLNAASEKPVTVQYALEPGTASANVDYSGFPGTLAIPEGAVLRTISVPIIRDNVFEPDETFFVNLSNPTNATVADAQGQGTISNDDPQPAITIGSSFRVEGALGVSANAAFDVRLSNPSYQIITVSYATADDSATAGSDYVATSGTVTFNPGETLKTINVQVLGDNIDEINERYFVNLTNPVNATIAVAQGGGTIQDDDGPTVSLNNVSVTEGNSGITNAVFTATLSAASVQDVFVTYGTSGGTATSNIDFFPAFSLTLVIPAGTTSRTFIIRVVGDFQIEPDEQFTVNVQTVTNATIANGTGTGTILNDDAPGKLQFSSSAYSVNEDAGSMLLTVNRVDGSTGTITIDYATSGGTATAGSDYGATSGTLTFTQGQTTISFSVPITGDNLFEPAETINLTLSNPTAGAVLGNPSTAVLTITTPPLLIALDQSGPGANQVAAWDSLLLTRDPFPLISPDVLYTGQDRNTRVTVVVTNLQLAPNDLASAVTINLVDGNGQIFDVAAESVRTIPVFNFTQIVFRLPDGLALGTCNLKIRSHDQESNLGTIRIRN